MSEETLCACYVAAALVTWVGCAMSSRVPAAAGLDVVMGLDVVVKGDVPVMVCLSKVESVKISFVHTALW